MPTFLRSLLLPVPHGFSTRVEGVSPAPFHSLNLSFQVGDDAAHVQENLARVAKAGGFSPGALAMATQVHQDTALWADDWAGERPSVSADALLSKNPRQAVGVRVADCVPVLMCDPVSCAVAAVHSGWRGTDLEISARVVEALCRAGARAKDIRVAVGPHIRACCYEVSEELARKFNGKFGPDAVKQKAGRPHLDLSCAVRVSLDRAGIAPEHVDLLPACTSCDSARFFSHRRDRGQTGRHVAFISAQF